MYIRRLKIRLLHKTRYEANLYHFFVYCRITVSSHCQHCTRFGEPLAWTGSGHSDCKLFGNVKTVDPNLCSIVWGMRFPRAVLAFLTGAALSASGTVMQSILKNPLASSYTLGVSSGASLCAALVMVTGITIPFLGMFTMAAAGFCRRPCNGIPGTGLCRAARRKDGESDHCFGRHGIFPVCQCHSNASYGSVSGAPAADGVLADGRISPAGTGPMWP